MARFNTGGSCEFKHGATTRLTTTSTGVTVSGTVVATGADINGDLDVDGHTELDNVNVSGVITASQIGNDADFSGGPLSIHGTVVSIKGGRIDHEDMIIANQDGAVELYYDASEKLSTTNTGIDVTGDVTASANVSCVNLTPTGYIQIDDSTSGGNLYIGNNSDLKLFHNGSTNFIRSGADGHTIQIDNNNGVVGAKFIPAGAVELYHNGTKMCETSANGLALPSGKGIDFSATGGPASGTGGSELFDDYEEGTFSPAWFDSGGVFANYAVQYGQYTKIGNVVYFCFGLRISSFNRTPNSGQACRVGNLPYVSRVVGDDQEPVFNLYARLWGSGTPPETAWIRQSSGGVGSNHVDFYMDESQTGNDHQLVGADFDTSSTCRVIVNGFYYVS
jgi:hypothetical protein